MQYDRPKSTLSFPRRRKRKDGPRYANIDTEIHVQENILALAK